MAANELESRAFAGELAELERTWRAAEEVAEISTTWWSHHSSNDGLHDMQTSGNRAPAD